MAKYLITGADGQLGQCFQSIAQEFSLNELIFTNQNELDILSMNRLKKIYSNNPFDGIINCAAYTNVENAERLKQKANLLNADAVKNIGTFAKENSLFLVHFSTDHVFDGHKKKPYNEEDRKNPVNEYGKSKYRGEELLKKINCTHTTFRISWLFSPYGENFVKTILKLSETERKIKVVNDQWGRPTYGIDLARVIMKNISKPHFFKYNNYNYAQLGVTTWCEFASKILKYKNNFMNITPCLTSEYPSDVKRPKYAVLDTTRIENIFSLRIKNWELTLKDCLNRIHKL
tara:strand:+ start:32647 stop:33510 length:864 start_codon:yes stop_codon:yes gene_type:complete